MRLIMYDPGIVVWQSPANIYPFQIHQRDSRLSAAHLFAVKGAWSVNFYPQEVNSIERP